MIISHQHRYLFVELPRTGTTAIAKELVEMYGGTRILEKHATYPEFARQASEDEKQYFVFSTIRNPLDDAVSYYFKLRTDHHGRYTDPIRSKYRVSEKDAEAIRRGELPPQGKPRRRMLMERVELRAFRSIQAREDTSFSEFLLSFYHLPYDNWSRLAHQEFDFVMRFERLTEDFEEALQRIGIEPRRPLPKRNQTSERRRDFAEYYTPEAIERARWVFGPYMERWGYEFPPQFGDEPSPRWSGIAFNLLAIPRTLYWKHLRGRSFQRRPFAVPAASSSGGNTPTSPLSTKLRRSLGRAPANRVTGRGGPR